jgi:hypothetical protein
MVFRACRPVKDFRQIYMPQLRLSPDQVDFIMKMKAVKYSLAWEKRDKLDNYARGVLFSHLMK